MLSWQSEKESLENSRAVFCWVLKKVLVTWKKRYSLTPSVHDNYMGDCDFYDFLKKIEKRNSSLLTEKCTHHMCTAWWVFKASTLGAVINYMKGNITNIQRSSSCPSPAPLRWQPRCHGLCNGLVLPVPEFYKWSNKVYIRFCWALSLKHYFVRFSFADTSSRNLVLSSHA